VVAAGQRAVVVVGRRAAGVTGRSAVLVAGYGIAAAGTVRQWLAGLARWAAGRGLTPGVLTGIALLFALSAMAWFRGGTTTDGLAGTLAVLAWTAALAAARQVDAPSGAGVAASGSGAAQTARGVQQRRWLAAVAGVLGEGAIYGGIAAGGQAAGWSGMWPLAVIVVVTVAITEAAAFLGGAAATGAGAGTADADHARARLGAPPGARAGLAALMFMFHGPRMALFTVLVTEVAAICYASFRTMRLRRAGGAAGPPAAPRGSRSARRRPQSAERTAVLLACRDDGPVARWAGRLVQGNLRPLFPTVVGVLGTAGLAVLGLRDPSGAIALAPVAMLLLAAPGSSHPHDRRFDWLAPVLLLLGQLLYLAALGFAWAVPGPLVFAVCVLTAAWYANLATGLGEGGFRGLSGGGYRALSGGGLAGQSASIGWEGRIFVAGLAATLGLATLGYLGLTAYLAAAISRRWLAGYLSLRRA
jgi:hypothetical protein